MDFLLWHGSTLRDAVSRSMTGYQKLGTRSWMAPKDHIRQWITGAFDPADRLDEAKVHAAVIDPRTKDRTSEGRAFHWNEFQEACARPDLVPPRAMLIAPCGSGKTLAAWRWVAARRRERPV